MQYHEYANLFPMMPDADLMRLAEDIKEKGLSDPIITLDGMILDGRNRFKACGVNSITPTFEEYTGDDPLGYVVSHNLHRRHMDESQRGMVAAKMANLTHGGQGGKLNGSIELLTPITQAKAAEMLNIGVETIKRSKRVLKTGIKELEDMQTSGEISASAASYVAQLPEEEQRKAVSGGVAGVKEAAKKFVLKKRSDSSKPVNTSSENSGQDHQEKSSTLPLSGTKKIKIADYIPNDAEELWTQARARLNNILPSDISREKVLREIISYCETRIQTKK